MTTKIIAHRGASYLANHENTMEAFRLALEVNADCIELDVRQTFDKVLVVFHDEKMLDAPLHALTYQQLNALAASSGYEIPTLESVLQLCQGKTHLLIELKEAGYEKRVVTMIHDHLSYEDFSIQSFLDIVIRRVKKIDPNVHAGLLVGLEQADFSTRFNEYFPVRRLNECHADFISSHSYLATPTFLLRMRRANIPVNIWTVDQPKQLTYFLEQQVNGIITNRPDVGIYLRSRYEKEQSDVKAKRAKTHDAFQSVLSKIKKSPTSEQE